MLKESDKRVGKGGERERNEGFSKYIDNVLQISLIILLADVLQRLFRVCWEYVHYANYYLPENRLCTIIKRAFTYNLGTHLCLLAWTCIALARFAMTSRLPVPSIAYLAYIPIYWIYNAVQINHSTLDYAYMVRERHGLDYAEGMASNYYHGYLKLVLPKHLQHLSIRERIEKYENLHNVTFTIKRLIILIPDAAYGNGTLKSNQLQKVASLEPVVKERAGVNRSFTNDVYAYKLINETYHVVAELATPILSYFNSMEFTHSTTWQMREMKREILFKFAQTLKKLLNEWPETKNLAEIVVYNAQNSDGSHRDVGHVIVAHMQHLRNVHQQANL